MTEPEAGPVAATKEGSDCDNPANSPLLFSFSFSSGSYTMAEIYSHCTFLLILTLKVIRCCSHSPYTSCMRCYSNNGEMFWKTCHFTPQPQLFYSVFSFSTYDIHNSYLLYIFRALRQQVLLAAMSGCPWLSPSLSEHKVRI